LRRDGRAAVATRPSLTSASVDDLKECIMATPLRQKVMAIGLVVLFVLGLLALQAGGVGAHEPSARRGVTRAVLAGADGRELGVVRFVQRGGDVLVVAHVRGLSPGFHGFHVHERGLCEPPDFTSAGGHLNPGGAGHGDHTGDLPSLLVKQDGRAELVFSTDRFAVADLDDADGSAVIVHQGRDNFANIPDRYLSTTEDVFGPDSATLATGDAGARAACGVVTR
jgi:Cu-Zn family superoxide dismutase